MRQGTEVIPATIDRFDDVVRVLGCDEKAPCCCQYWRMSAGDYNRASLDGRRAALRSQLAETPAGGMLAYVDGEPAGWCRFAVRQQAERLVRSRTIPWIDDAPAWAIHCFTVQTGYRRRGVARALLDGVIDYARELGAPLLEAYQVETDGARTHGTAAYVGTTSMFEAAGFRRVLETDARSDHRPRWLMRLDLRS
ncbi:MAG: GNAT family N-acetyltransferase [Candidatus Limnocylindria bacterium]